MYPDKNIEQRVIEYLRQFNANSGSYISYDDEKTSKILDYIKTLRLMDMRLRE